LVARAFPDGHHPVDLVDVETVIVPWPLHFDFRWGGGSQPEGNAEIALGEIAAVAADFVHLPEGIGCRADDAGPRCLCDWISRS
jgi:hypothetical protein